MDKDLSLGMTMPQLKRRSAKTLETFRQNWEFYNRDPQRLAQLLINDPAKHAT